MCRGICLTVFSLFDETLCTYPHSSLWSCLPSLRRRGNDEQRWSEHLLASSKNKKNSFLKFMQHTSIYMYGDASQQICCIYTCMYTCTWNQSMVQQLTNDGNFLILVLKASPIGLMARTTCSCSLTRSMNMLKRARGVPSVCFDFSRVLR